MKTIYINTGCEKVFYSIKELKKNPDFQQRFSDYLIENGISESILSSKFDSFVTYERVTNFFNELCDCDNWKMFTTEKDFIYIRWGEEIITDNLDYLVSQLDSDRLYDLVTENYNSFEVLFKNIKNTKDTCNEFLLHNVLKYDSNYEVIDLTKVKDTKNEIYIDYKNQEYYTSYEELCKKTKDFLDKSHTQELYKQDYRKDFLSTDNDVVYIDWIGKQVYDNVFKLLLRTRSPITADHMKIFIDTITSAKGDYNKLVSLFYDSDSVTTVHFNK